MSQPRNPYASKAPTTVTTRDEENVLMHDSPSSKNSSEEAQTNDAGMEDDECSQARESHTLEEEVNFEEDFQIPPSFSQMINEETLRDNDHPYIFWASLRMPIPKDLPNSMVAVYDALKEFITQFADEDPHFVVYPYRLSAYESIKDLPLPIETPDDIPDYIDDWLKYFPGAKPQITRGDTYTALLIGMSKPLTKVVKIWALGFTTRSSVFGRHISSRNN